MQSHDVHGATVHVCDGHCLPPHRGVPINAGIGDEVEFGCARSSSRIDDGGYKCTADATEIVATQEFVFKIE